MSEGSQPHETYGYNPHRLLNVLRQNHLLKSDAELARFLEVSPPIICKIRHRTTAVSGALLIRMHEVTGLTIEDLRYLMGDRRRKFRVGGGNGETAAGKASAATVALPVLEPLVAQWANVATLVPECSVPKQAIAAWPEPETSIPPRAKKCAKWINRRW
jgi:DNA-binding transcriptional regulator YdaS (Cro superfamily)